MKTYQTIGSTYSIVIGVAGNQGQIGVQQGTGRANPDKHIGLIICRTNDEGIIRITNTFPYADSMEVTVMCNGQTRSSTVAENTS